MRLGLLGPAGGDLDALEAGARLLIEREGADRVLYLGVDDALDRVVSAWASRLVGDDPTDAGLPSRAARRCVHADPEEIDRFVAAERARLRLRALHNLPQPHPKTVEIVGGRLVVIVHARGQLVEEDIAPASVLVFGDTPSPAVRRVGKRTFVSPGSATTEGGGVALLSESDGGVRLAMLDRSGVRVRDEVVAAGRAAQMRVQGESNG